MQKAPKQGQGRTLKRLKEDSDEYLYSTQSSIWISNLDLHWQNEKMYNNNPKNNGTSMLKIKKKDHQGKNKVTRHPYSCSHRSGTGLVIQHAHETRDGRSWPQNGKNQQAKERLEGQIKDVLMISKSQQERAGYRKGGKRIVRETRFGSTGVIPLVCHLYHKKMNKWKK